MVQFYGFSQGHKSTGQAEHWLGEIVAKLPDPDRIVACTHFIRVPYPHVAISLAVPGTVPADLPVAPPHLADAAAHAVAEHVARHSGRAVRYPGVDQLVGMLTVGEVLAASAIERVVVLGGAEPALDTLLDTRDFVRPEWRAGRLTLVATAAGPGRIAPYEVPDPAPSCADHA